ncbi:PTS sugar transporter subunit IIA [Mixta tenebrionis]|uniref:PTS sugar transporter subunit IIA n=1 Tax=Mixta tenebrionis TaxID=2562439 RepID=A0A506VFM1_9GAMM|nr:MULTISPECIES: PTS sugar transporter subunit IIA [Mixta]QHM75897.1 Ascorbate-specific PTS system EIIA component [Mixta theicola]TPW44425.1 PTS sugar transporter subunit IIA [Mixta tenebrionis]
MINDMKWVQARREAQEWRQALEIATRPLIAFGAAEPVYLQGIIDNTLSWGPYYLLAPGIALPHARPEQGANHNQICVTTLATPVAFGHEECDPVWLLISASATDADAHIRTIQRISELIDSPERVAALRQAQTDEALYRLLRA